MPGHVDRRQRRRDGFRQAGCASYFLEVPWPLEDSEKAARRDDAQSEDLPAKRVSILRTKERYVPDVCAAVGDPHGRRMRCGTFAGCIGSGPYIPLFVSASRKTYCFPVHRRIGRRARRRRLVPDDSANVVPGRRRGVPSPMAAGRTLPPWSAGPASVTPGTGV